MDARSHVLQVAVIGAGIAGLSSAISLSRGGHNVEIYERSSLANEVGAAIHVCPNASRILKRWGFDFESAKAVLVEEGRVVNATTLAASYSMSYDRLKDQYGSPWYFLHRVDLHNELKRLALAPGDGYPAAKLFLGTVVDTVDCSTGTITLRDGRRTQKDLIIAADGIHSTIASTVNGSSIPAAETGQSAFRFLIPTQKLIEAGLADTLFINSDYGMSIAADATRRLVWYPCRRGELQNFVGIHPSRPDDCGSDAWNIGANVDSILHEYQSFHPDLVKACSLAEDPKLWKLLYRSPIPTWYRGKVALAGDAAHPMLPHQGQGGAQAIEDAAAFGTLFASTSSVNDVTERLGMYQEVRRRRAAAIQIFSNAGQDQAEKIQEEARQYVDGHVPTNQAEFHKFNFGHDVVAACEEMLAQLGTGRLSNDKP